MECSTGTRCMIELAPPSKVMTYSEAILYCQFLEYNGYRDWRLPTRDEFGGNTNIWGWFIDRNTGQLWRVTPVRDI